MTHRFTQLDVFGSGPLTGNPLAVVHDADGLADVQLAAFARWTNLSETTFLLPPTVAGADYRVRIFTPGGELPFAGHPTLGSARAWLAAGGVPQGADVVQECGAGLVRVRRDGDRLAFAAPPLLRSGPVEPTVLADVVASLQVEVADVRAAAWIDNGPGWLGVLLGSAAAVLGLRPDFGLMGDLKVGVVGATPAGAGTDFEVRAFVPSMGVPEDPVTGSLNAGLGQWLIGAGLAPPAYVVSQGAALQRAGRVHVEQRGADVWVGGRSAVRITGVVDLGD
ncbi:MAG: PhzF family phenazine biosynthesis protein [Frankiales bacterium]|nr:PhzF family phenazine biosynthesis protein [Frankiales bacterium]